MDTSHLDTETRNYIAQLRDDNANLSFSLAAAREEVALHASICDNWEARYIALDDMHHSLVLTHNAMLAQFRMWKRKTTFLLNSIATAFTSDDDDRIKRTLRIAIPHWIAWRDTQPD